MGRRSCTRKELESLIGLLHQACTVVRPGKTFLRRMFELLSIARKGHHHIRLNDEFCSELLWWQAFLAPFNHRPMRRVVGSTHSAKISISSDASGGIGCGAF